MSGGSWSYIGRQLRPVSDRLRLENSPLRRVLGRHMELVAEAMHQIEWVDSGDNSSPADTNAIKAVFDDLAATKELEEILTETIAALKRLEMNEYPR